MINNADISQPMFRMAIDAIADGNNDELQRMLQDHPNLVRERIDLPEPGYFMNPFLLWFIADNPVRQGKLPSNIVAVTELLLQFVKINAPESLQEQLDYTLGLVVTGRIPRECGVQIELIDLLIDTGANPGGGLGALAHGNQAAAKRLLERGGELNLATAVCLDYTDDINRLAGIAAKEDKQVALIAASFYGKAAMIRFLLELGADPNEYIAPSSGFHSHASALHQAVYSGSLEAVKLLVAAGARLDLPDKTYGGTPPGWAAYMQSETNDDEMIKKYREIEDFFRLS